ncbi:MAG: 3-hydroxyacyl-CoA dehydrogenase family protein [Gemmatimonadetes bacterium]|nr:3-hydroxyacyl-CoA dehydrogenase family protein [Gemmatimonadota bacterium]
MSMSVKRVAVLGAGTMGHGIAQAAAYAGIATTIFDPDTKTLEQALERIRATLEKGVQRGKVTPVAMNATLSSLTLAASLAEAVDGADLIIEAVPERLELKRDIFREVDAAAMDGALLATNTSSLSVSEIAAATTRSGEVIGLHFFNPVHIMRLLEVVRGKETTDESLTRALAFAAQIGKEAIVVTDTPGFASSRLGVVLGLEAMRMVEQGVASPQDIDRAMELGYNHPMGPLRLTDLVGLDVRLGIAEYLHSTLGGPQYEPPEILRQMVAAGRIGKKSGRGFYDWEDS